MTRPIREDTPGRQARRTEYKADQLLRRPAVIPDTAALGARSIPPYFGPGPAVPDRAETIRYPGGVVAISAAEWTNVVGSYTNDSTGYCYRQTENSGVTATSYAAASSWIYFDVDAVNALSNDPSGLGGGGLTMGREYRIMVTYKLPSSITGNQFIAVSQNGGTPVPLQGGVALTKNATLYIPDEFYSTFTVQTGDTFDFRAYTDTGDSFSVWLDGIWLIPAGNLPSGDIVTYHGDGFWVKEGPTASGPSDFGLTVLGDTQGPHKLGIWAAAFTMSAWWLFPSNGGSLHPPEHHGFGDAVNLVGWQGGAGAEEAAFDQRHARHMYLFCRYNADQENVETCHATVFESGIPKTDVHIGGRSYGLHYFCLLQPAFGEFQLALWEHDFTGSSDAPYMGELNGGTVTDIRVTEISLVSSYIDLLDATAA